MLSVLAILGKIAEFLAKSMQGKTLARELDKRGQACAAFTRLYYLLVELNTLTEYLLDRATDCGVLAFAFRDCEKRIASLANDFVETFTSIRDALEIFAPDLAETLSVVAYSKCNLLWEISQYVVIEGGGSSAVRKVNFLKPDEKILNLDIGAFAQRLKNGEAQQRAERFEWPDRLLYYGSAEGSFSPDELNFVDQGEVDAFAKTLRQHSNVLSQGIIALKNYIKTTFTLDEVLYERADIEPAFFR